MVLVRVQPPQPNSLALKLITRQFRPLIISGTFPTFSPRIVGRKFTRHAFRTLPRSDTFAHGRVLAEDENHRRFGGSVQFRARGFSNGPPKQVFRTFCCGGARIGAIRFPRSRSGFAGLQPPGADRRGLGCCCEIARLHRRVGNAAGRLFAGCATGGGYTECT